MKTPLHGSQMTPAITGTKETAQRRADQIKAFGHELEELERDKILLLTPEQRERIGGYHAETLKRLARQFDIDVTPAAKQMSLGMRVVSFLGALALSSAVFFFFYHFWGYFDTPVQVAILITAPLMLLGGVEFAARREKTLYFASLMGQVAFFRLRSRPHHDRPDLFHNAEPERLPRLGAFALILSRTAIACTSSSWQGRPACSAISPPQSEPGAASTGSPSGSGRRTSSSPGRSWLPRRCSPGTGRTALPARTGSTGRSPSSHRRADPFPLGRGELRAPGGHKHRTLLPGRRLWPARRGR